MDADDSEKRKLAALIVRQTPLEHRGALFGWARDLRDLAASKLPAMEKAKRALELTREAKVIWPIIATIAKEVKRHGWDHRSATQRLGLSIAGLTLAVFGGATAGIAALGGAIAVPLWAVFGGGAMLLNYLYEELVNSRLGDEDPSSTTINLEAEHDDRER